MTGAEKKRVLVVGGGFAGLTAASALTASYDVLLLDPKPVSRLPEGCRHSGRATGSCTCALSRAGAAAARCD